ncbi:MFS transporter [Cupriavidus sp. CuC1]|uniref:MFS transporter n=1 Tax=Cupriavidus sp. CuC1 TaxID=3373131 RepID=UPI0037CDF744
MESSGSVIARLGVAQTLAWGSTYYLPAMLATSMARDLGVSTPTVFAAFSAALIVSAILGPSAGRLIDRTGDRPVLVGTSLIFAIGLAALGMAQGVVGMFVAWLIIGIGMGSELYEAAFATLVALYGNRSRNAITGITLIAGFASTVGWPLSTFMESHIGWRGACLSWAALHPTLGFALNLSMPGGSFGDVSLKPTNNSQAIEVPTASELASQRFASFALAFVFAATWFISTAMAAHLPRLLEAGGATLATAVMVGALIGPAQVAARLLEFGLLRKVHPLLSVQPLLSDVRERSMVGRLANSGRALSRRLSWGTTIQPFRPHRPSRRGEVEIAAAPAIQLIPDFQSSKPVCSPANSGFLHYCKKPEFVRLRSPRIQ